jgi:hypothetical protein
MVGSGGRWLYLVVVEGVRFANSVGGFGWKGLNVHK